MGRAKLRLKRVKLDDFSKGFFPMQDFDDVPDGGTSDCKHVIYDRSFLRPMFGMDRLNSVQAGTLRGNGAFFLDVSGVQKRAFVFGSKFYEDASGTMTDRTGAVTITDGADNLWQFVNHQSGANKYLIGANNVDSPIKWTGAGNIAVLGGSPPIFGSVARYHETIFGSINEVVHPSDTNDPETWDNPSYSFDRDIKRLNENGPTLAVMMERYIGSLQGYDFLDFSKEDVEISGVGCVGRLAAANIQFGSAKTKAIATVSRDGIWVIDEAYGFEKVVGNQYWSDFNQANIHKSIMAYDSIDRLLFVALPKDSTENDYLLVIDCDTGALWPCPNVHANSIRAMAYCQDDSGNQWVYFVDSNGYAFKFNRESKNYHTGVAAEAIDSRWKSKKFDLEDIHSLRMAAMLATASGDWNVDMAVGFGLTADDGEQGEINLQDDSDLLGSSFILGASTLGGSDYIFKTLSSVGGFGRFLTITISNSDLDETFNIRKLELQLKRRRMGGVDK